VQAGTTFILVLAANTAYADFPRLASILARDRFLPRQFMNQGDRLAFSNGILGLSAFAAVLLIVFHGDTNALIPLYMIGVFVSFTLSQAGMVVRWRRLRTPHWQWSALVNGIGALVTGIVLVVVAMTKALEGAWIILILIPVNVWVFRATKRHYNGVADQLTLSNWTPEADRTDNIVVVPISGVHRAVVQAVDYAKTLSPDVRAVYVGLNAATTEELQKNWTTWGRGVPLVVLESPYRSLMEPLLEYLETIRKGRRAFVTVVLPEFVPARWWHALFHNQSALLIKGALLFEPNTVVTSVPFHLQR
jgi:cbb3-type cytochrome oxidase subunit 3